MSNRAIRAAALTGILSLALMSPLLARGWLGPIHLRLPGWLKRRRVASLSQPASLYGHVIRVSARGSKIATDLSLRLPPAPPAVSASRLAALAAAARSEGSAAAWRRYADAAVRAGAYDAAAAAYRREAAVYRRTGDGEAALVEESKARRWSTRVALYLHHPATAADLSRNYTGARLEPRLGCYVGAFIDRDDNLPHYLVDNQTYGDVRVFDRMTGKDHASFFMYRRYGQPFPLRWARYLKRNGAIPHIAWEPRRLSDVRNDAYLREFVDDVRRLDWPVFIRFAGEMNGDWTPYHGNPAAYRAAFRRVYRAFRRAPRAALIWCPNSVPQNKIDEYYPGDAYTDWVGVNMYSVLYQDDNRARSGRHVFPTDLLDYVYRRYSARKPICIGEYAATHEAAVDGLVRPGFTIHKIAQLYDTLITRYPRVKMVSWYDCNNLVHAQPGRQLNDYLLTDDSDILTSYARAIDSSYFLDARDVRGHEASPVAVERLRSGMRVGPEPVIEGWVRTYVSNPSVFFRVDGRVVMATRDPLRCRIQITGLSPGRHVIELLAYDAHNRRVGDERVTVIH